METLTPVEARKVLTDAQASVVLALPPCDVEEKVITQDGVEVRLTIVRPAGSKVVLPGFIFVHGGGWVLGDFPTHERFVRDLVADSGFTAIFANYTPSPEARYPTAINQIHAAARWVAANGDEIKVDWANPRILPPWPSFSRPTRPRGSPATLSGSEVAPGSNDAWSRLPAA